MSNSATTSAGAAGTSSSSFPEGAAEYLSNTNFKSLMEWMTAEVLFHRPDDPLAFVKAIVSKKLAERGSEKYNPRDNDKYLKECYDDISDVDPSAVTAVVSDTKDADDALTTRLEVLEKLIKASRAIAMKLDPFEATQNIIYECCDILGADRATLFKMSGDRQKLELMVAEGARSITVPLGTGIAGSVGSSGITINIPDAYQDSRFDPSHDKTTGYRTRSILCAPVKDGNGHIIGVLQAINKLTGVFDEVDEEIMGIFAAQAGIALRNAELYTMSIKAQARARCLLDIIKAMHADLGMSSLMFTITQRTTTLVDADRCTFFLVNHTSHELWSLQGDVDIRIPMDKGIAGAVATTGDTVNIPDAYADPRFNQEVDRASGYTTRTILCMPLKGTNGAVLGVIQLINKSTGPFTEEDEELMSSFLTIAGPIVENSQLVVAAAKVETGTEFSGKQIKRGPSAGSGLSASAILEEGDEDEEEEDEDE